MFCRSLAFVIGALWAAAAQAATITVSTRSEDPDRGIFTIEGDLEHADGERFQAMSTPFQRGIVLFASPGGKLAAGLALGTTIRMRGYVTGVADGATCASACAIAWLGGAQRFMSNTARVGFHAAYRPDGTEIGSGNALVGAYLSRIGLSDAAVVFITSARPEEMSWLDLQKAQKVGIDVSMLPAERPVTNLASVPAQQVNVPATPPQTVSPANPAPSYHYVDGLDPAGHNWLALRLAPSYQAPWSPTQMGPGTLLTVTAEVGEWRRVELLTGEVGWANAHYLRCCRTNANAALPQGSGGRPYHYVTGLDPAGNNWLALRVGPSFAAPWLPTRMGPGTPLVLLGQSGEWLRVRLRTGEEGWANARYVACCKG